MNERLLGRDGGRSAQTKRQMGFSGQGNFFLASQGCTGRACTSASASAYGRTLASPCDSADQRPKRRTATDGNDVAFLMGLAFQCDLMRMDINPRATRLNGGDGNAEKGGFG